MVAQARPCKRTRSGGPVIVDDLSAESREADQSADSESESHWSQPSAGEGNAGGARRVLPARRTQQEVSAIEEAHSNAIEEAHRQVEHARQGEQQAQQQARAQAVQLEQLQMQQRQLAQQLQTGKFFGTDTQLHPMT